jgi:FAD/FMN-containing dehydrogenase
MVIAEQAQRKPVFGASTLQDLRDSLKGNLILPGDDGYDEARTVFNGMIDRKPSLIVQPLDTEDVVAAVDFGRSHDLLVSIKGGGHSAPGHGVCHNGLVIDLSLMKGVEVDVERRVAKAQPGLRLGEFITETEKYGLVSPTGTVSDTGLAGLTLGGGYGWLAGKYGMAVDNLVGAEVVTADGRVLHVSEDEHTDLFWALRGGSGNFGVVTSFELKLYPVTQLLGGMLIYPFPMAREVLRLHREMTANAPDELTAYAALITAPDGNQAIAVALAYCGDLEAGEKLIAPYREIGPVVDMVRPLPYSEMNTLLDAANPPGMQNYWKWQGLKHLEDDAINTILEYAAKVPSPRSVILIDQLHGAAARVDPGATAFAHRDAPHGLVIISMF